MDLQPCLYQIFSCTRSRITGIHITGGGVEERPQRFGSGLRRNGSDSRLDFHDLDLDPDPGGNGMFYKEIGSGS